MKQKWQLPMEDRWECYDDYDKQQDFVLTSIEFTTTNRCNMRCRHCAVGDALQAKDPARIPLSIILRRLNEVETLRTMSFTGGEPFLDVESIQEFILPLLKHARKRDIHTQVNSNATMPLKRYLSVMEYIDVLHVSHNWGTQQTYTDAGFINFKQLPPLSKRQEWFERLFANCSRLSDEGMFISAETLLSKETADDFLHIHNEVVHAMKAKRHEINPLIMTDFAKSLVPLSLDEIRRLLEVFLQHRDLSIWTLLGAFPILPCSEDVRDQAIWQRLITEKNISVRNDPDGRNRLNVNSFSGDVFVTDFHNDVPIGNIIDDSLTNIFQRWKQSYDAKQIHCHCPAIHCLGPNHLVKSTYYGDVNFSERKTYISRY